MKDVTGVWISSAVLWPGDLYEQKLTTEYTIKPHKHIDKVGTRKSERSPDQPQAISFVI